MSAAKTEGFFRPAVMTGYHTKAVNMLLKADTSPISVGAGGRFSSCSGSWRRDVIVKYSERGRRASEGQQQQLNGETKAKISSLTIC